MPLTHWIPVLQGSDGRASCHGASLATLKPVAELDERALILEAQGGRRAAFEELVPRSRRGVLRLAPNLMRRPEDARDVYQEAFLKLYKNIQRFRFECSFYTWLYRIVTNVCLDHLRRRQARPEDQAPEIHVNRQEGGTRDFFEFQREHRPAVDAERRMGGEATLAGSFEAMGRVCSPQGAVF